MTVEQWFDAMTFGLRELWLRAMTREEIDKAVDATFELWRLMSEAGK